MSFSSNGHFRPCFFLNIFLFRSGNGSSTWRHLITYKNMLRKSFLFNIFLFRSGNGSSTWRHLITYKNMLRKSVFTFWFTVKIGFELSFNVKKALVPSGIDLSFEYCWGAGNGSVVNILLNIYLVFLRRYLQRSRFLCIAFEGLLRSYLPKTLFYINFYKA